MTRWLAGLGREAAVELRVASLHRLGHHQTCMRFFTRGWADGELGDDEVQRVVSSYKAQLAELTPRMTVDQRRLAELSLHDAVIERVRWYERERKLVIVFVAFGPDDGYSSVSVTYTGAMLGQRPVEVLREVARNRDAVVLHTEVDIGSEGTFSHRMLFWPRDELTIDCASVAVEVAPRADQRVELGGAFCVEDLPDVASN